MDRNLIAGQFEAIHESCDLEVPLIVDSIITYSHLALSNLPNHFLSFIFPLLTDFAHHLHQVKLAPITLFIRAYMICTFIDLDIIIFTKMAMQHRKLTEEEANKLF